MSNFIHFNNTYNFIYGLIIISIGLSIVYKIYNIYKDTGQKRFAFLIPALLISVLFELIHISNIFDTHSIYLLLIFLNSSYQCIGLLGLLFIKNNNPNEKISPKESTIYFCGLIALFIFEYIMFNLPNTQDFFATLINYATTFIWISILFTFVFIKILKKDSLINNFNLGLFFITLSSIYIANPTNHISLYEHAIHMARLLGGIFILLGINVIKENFQQYRMRIKLFLLPNFFMLLFLIIFITLDYSLFNLVFSDITYILFILFYIVYLTSQTLFIDNTTSPIREMTQNLKQFEPDKKPILINIYGNDEIGILAENINKVSERQWQYNQEIKEKQTQIQELMNSRDSFIAALSHDLKSPIFAEQKLIESILLDRETIKVADFIEYLEDMYKINDEVLRIVNNLLTAYHLDSQKLELHYEQTDINILIENAQNTLKHLAKDENIILSVNLMQGIPLINMDKDMISRIITNLISNAIKHSRRSNEIKISTLQINENIQVTIQDFGKGIPEEEKPNIFQKYPSSKRTVGTGLGLYISKQIIDAHKGKIWFKSETGKGTTFYFTLPYKQ